MRIESGRAGYEFEWDPRKAEENLHKHGVSFEEACTVFADPLAMLKADPDHSAEEQRFILLGTSKRGSLLVVAFGERAPRTRLISAHAPFAENGGSMKKGRTSRVWDDSDTMRPEYDFRGAVRGVTAARYAQGTNVVAVDPELRDVFPDSLKVNEALRALAPLLREQRGGKQRRTGRSTRPRPRGGSAKVGTSASGRGG